MERRACVVCETNEFAQQYCHLQGQDYLRCDNCGLVYVDRLLKPEELYKAYSGNSFKSLRRKLIAPIRKFNWSKSFDKSMRRARGIFEFGQKQVTAGGEKRRYMDIGCNKGFLLATAHEHGWDVYGIELVRELIRPFINSYPQYKDHVFSERFEDAKENVEKESFDLITAIDVVEHFEDVIGDLQGIYNLIKPGGVFLIQTPDTACERADQEKCDWGALKPLEHLHVFNCENFTSLAKRAGFTEIKCFAPFEEADGNFVAVLRK